MKNSFFGWLFCAYSDGIKLKFKEVKEKNLKKREFRN